MNKERVEMKIIMLICAVFLVMIGCSRKDGFVENIVDGVLHKYEVKMLDDKLNVIIHSERMSPDYVNTLHFISAEMTASEYEEFIKENKLKAIGHRNIPGKGGTGTPLCWDLSNPDPKMCFFKTVNNTDFYAAFSGGRAYLYIRD